MYSYPKWLFITFPTLLTTSNDNQEETHWVHVFYFIFALFAIVVVLLIDRVIQLDCNAQPPSIMAFVISVTLLYVTKS